MLPCNFKLFYLKSPESHHLRQRVLCLSQTTTCYLFVDERTACDPHSHPEPKGSHKVRMVRDGRNDGAESDAGGVQVGLPQLHVGVGGEISYEAAQQNRLDDPDGFLSGEKKRTTEISLERVWKIPNRQKLHGILYN